MVATYVLYNLKAYSLGSRLNLHKHMFKIVHFWLSKDQSQVIENPNNILNMSLNKKPTCELCLNWTMHSNWHNLRSLATQKKNNIHTHFHTYTHTQNKTKRLLTKSIDNATQHYDLSNGGFLGCSCLFVCYMSNMVGGGKKSENQQYYNGEGFASKKNPNGFLVAKWVYRCKTHLDSYYSSTISLKIIWWRFLYKHVLKKHQMDAFAWFLWKLYK